MIAGQFIIFLSIYSLILLRISPVVQDFKDSLIENHLLFQIVRYTSTDE